MDFGRITHPLKLARGSHQSGSDKGCAMNVIADGAFMIHGPHRSVSAPLATIMSDGHFCTDADSSSARSCGIGMGCALPSVLSGLSGHCCAG
jgi:hypothetical protein